MTAKLQAALVAFLDATLPPESFVMAIGTVNGPHPVLAHGGRKGAAPLMVVTPRKVVFIALPPLYRGKPRRLTDDEAGFRDDVLRAGHRWIAVTTVDEAAIALEKFGIPLRLYRWRINLEKGKAA